MQDKGNSSEIRVIPLKSVESFRFEEFTKQQLTGFIQYAKYTLRRCSLLCLLWVIQGGKEGPTVAELF